MGDQEIKASVVTMNDASAKSVGGKSRSEFLIELDEILDLPAGTLQGNERLEDLDNWDSTSLITFIAMAETNCDVSISPAQIVTCSTVADLLRLAKIESRAS